MKAPGPHVFFPPSQRVRGPPSWPGHAPSLARPWLGCGTSPLFAGWITIECCWTSIENYGWIMNSDNSQKNLKASCFLAHLVVDFQDLLLEDNLNQPRIASFRSVDLKLEIGCTYPEIPLSEIGCTSKSYSYIYTHTMLCINIYTHIHYILYIRICLICVFMCIYIYMATHIYIYVCMHAFLFTMCLCACVHVLFCMFIHEYVYCVCLTHTRQISAAKAPRESN